VDLQRAIYGQIERGDITVSLIALDKIVTSTGSNIDYIVYGNQDNFPTVRKRINTLLDLSSEDELIMYYKCISAIRECPSKNKQLL